MSVQVQIPPALAALHNFIMEIDPHDVDEYLADSDEEESDLDPNPGQPMENEFGVLAGGHVTQAEKNQATANRDRIARAMWTDYENILAARGINM